MDLLEPSKHLLDVAVRKLGAPGAAAAGGWPAGHAIGRSFCMGLQAFEPEAGRYDCIWTQWCLLYLTDVDLLALLDRCRAGLTADGIVFVKENTCRSGFIMDPDDSSLTRSSAYLSELFERAGWRVLYSAKQKGFPKELYEVRMFVLRPR